MNYAKQLIHFIAFDEPETIVDWFGKVLIYFGIVYTGREFAAGMACAIAGQVAVSLNDKPQTIGEALKRLTGTFICAFFAAMCSGFAIVNSIPLVLLMGIAGAFSMTIIKIMDKMKKRADDTAEQTADKIIGKVSDKLK